MKKRTTLYISEDIDKIIGELRVGEYRRRGRIPSYTETLDRLLRENNEVKKKLPK